jgi:cytochrome c oxidase assembly protein subunit 15
MVVGIFVILPPLSSTNRTADADLRGIARTAKATLGYTIFVVLFGAIVRITGSGAGCGQHWPTCHGEIAHLPRRIETLIELSHRVTSGGALLAALALAYVTGRSVPARHPLRRVAYAVVALMILEALIGAGLVLWRLVAEDTSAARAVVMPAHLLSTYALLAVLTLAVRWSAPPSVDTLTSPAQKTRLSLVLAAGALVLVSAAGAVTALGDTVYPPVSATLAGRWGEDQAAGAHFLQRLRGLHPVLAVLGAALVARLVFPFASAARRVVRRSSLAVLVLLGVQLLAGVLNVYWLAPGWLQVVHLGLALALWIAFVTLSVELGVPARAEPVPEAPHADGVLAI